MRHQCSYRKFNRSAAHRKALLRSMVTALLTKERCETTLPRAKDLKRVTEKLITLARQDNLARRKQAHGYLLHRGAVVKLFTEIGPRFRSRPGGYTRVVRSGHRMGDAAPLAVIELVERAQPKPAPA